MLIVHVDSAEFIELRNANGRWLAGTGTKCPQIMESANWLLRTAHMVGLSMVPASENRIPIIKANTVSRFWVNTTLNNFGSINQLIGWNLPILATCLKGLVGHQVIVANG